MNDATLNVALLLYLNDNTTEKSNRCVVKKHWKNTVASTESLAPEISHRQRFVSDVT